MEVEKIASGGAMPYQGSSAAPIVPVAEAAAQSVSPAPQALKPAAKQDFSLDKRTGEKAENADDAGNVQSAQLKSAVSDLNKQMKNSEAIFGIHEKTNRVTIKIVDKSTKEVIKEFPPEQTLDMIAKVWEVAGILVDEKM